MRLATRCFALGSLLLAAACSSSSSTGSGGGDPSGGGGDGAASSSRASTGAHPGSTSTTSSAGGGGGTSSGGGGGAGGEGGQAGGAPFAPGTICNDTGGTRDAPAHLEHILVFMFENQDLGSVVGNAAAPYMSSLATKCGYAKKFQDDCFYDNLFSLPHYLAATSGSNCNTGLDRTGDGCITDDGDATGHKLTTKSIFDQVSSWRSYQESMPSACDKSSSGEYAAKHNPAAYYSNLAGCSANDVAIAAITCSASAKNTPCSAPSNVLVDDLANDTLPAYAFVTPNLANDMHDGTVTQGDNWLNTYMTLVLASKPYLDGKLAVFVLWDEQSSLAFGGATPNIFVSPYIKAGTVATADINHFAVLRATEKALGINEYLGCAAGHLPGNPSPNPCPPDSTADVRALLGF